MSETDDLRAAHEEYEAVRLRAAADRSDHRYGNPHHAALLLAGQKVANATTAHLAASGTTDRGKG